MVCRWKDAFFKDRETSNVAKNVLIEEVEKVMATTLPVSADGEETPAARRESSSSEPDTTTSGTTSIIAQMRKRIRLEQQQQVGVEEENSPKKVVEDYLKLPQEEYHVLRFELHFQLLDLSIASSVFATIDPHDVP